jgi:hypothetical protein
MAEEISTTTEKVPAVDPFDQVTALYHFTDRRNLPNIRELKGLYSLAKLKEMQVAIPNPGGNKWSHDADQSKGMDHYNCQRQESRACSLTKTYAALEKIKWKLTTPATNSLISSGLTLDIATHSWQNIETPKMEIKVGIFM